MAATTKFNTVKNTSNITHLEVPDNIDRIDDCSLAVAQAQSLLRVLVAASDGESFPLLAHSDVLNTLEAIGGFLEQTKGSLRKIDLTAETTH